MSELEHLEAAVVENPQDLESCSVYADFLQERSDPMGGVLALHVAILKEQDPKRQVELKLLLKGLLDSKDLFGDLAKRRDELELAFYLGVLERTRIRPRDAKSKSWLPSAELMRTFLALPIARFVSRLTIPKYALDEVLEDLAKRLEANTALRHLRMFRVEAASDGGAKGARVSTRRRPPNLELLSILGGTLKHLDVASIELNAKGLSLPNLVTLTLGAQPAAQLKTLKPSGFPKLERVVLATNQVNDVSPLAKVLPTIRVIRLTGYPTTMGDALEKIRKALPKVTEFELNDASRRQIAELSAKFRGVSLVGRATVSPD